MSGSLKRAAWMFGLAVIGLAGYFVLSRVVVMDETSRRADQGAGDAHSAAEHMDGDTISLSRWVEEGVRDAHAALERMEGHTNVELRAAMRACITLVERREFADGISSLYIKRSSVPFEIEALGANLDTISVNEWGCTIHMHKGVANGIGYHFELDTNRTWRASSFNTYESWESKEINLDVQRADGA